MKRILTLILVLFMCAAVLFSCTILPEIYDPANSAADDLDSSDSGDVFDDMENSDIEDSSDSGDASDDMENSDSEDSSDNGDSSDSGDVSGDIGGSENGGGSNNDNDVIDPAEDDIGEYDFDGANFTILTRSETNYEYVGDIESVDRISKAVYERNQAVADRFNVNILTDERKGGYDTRDEFVTAVRSEYMSPTSAYDLISTHSVYLGWFGVEGILTDLSALPEIDLTKEYWGQSLYDELNIDGTCYIMIGDIGHTLYEYMSVMFVNTNILEEYRIIDDGINGIYDMVDDGTWTWEALYNLSKDYGSDTENESYGLLFNTHAMRAGIMSQDVNLYQRGENGRFMMESTASNRLIKSVENLSQFFAKTNMYFAEGWGTDENLLNPIFTSNHALFYGQTLGQSSKFVSDMQDGYAVLPLPKYDNFQEKYYTICREQVTAVGVMNNTKDKEMSGVITQALAKYGSEIVTPEYYERALKYRYNSDPRCPDMLELIRSGLTIFAPATFYETGIDIDMFRNIIVTGSNEGIASRYESYVQRGNEELSDFYELIDKLKK